MKSYLKQHTATPRRSSQAEPIPGRESEMVENSAGGYVFEVDPLQRLQRFLILGSEGGSYYATERDLTKQNVTAMRATINALGPKAVEVIRDVSVGGRAPKNDPAVLALAIAAGSKDEETRAAALKAIPDVCRIGTHLFHFLEFVEGERGWGRALKRAVAEWYTEQPLGKVAYQAVKYRQRDGWSHRDALRLAKPKGSELDPTRNALLRWIVGKDADRDLLSHEDLRAIEAFERAQASENAGQTASLIREYGGLLPREALKTEHLSDKLVNIALVEAGMPMTALIRNLANLTRYGVIGPMSSYNSVIAEQIADPERLRKARVHPLSVLMALMTYKSGRSVRGTSSWTPEGHIIDALDDAFYGAFGNVEATGKRHMLSLDVSGSMHSMWGAGAGVGGAPGLTPAMASAAMSMVTARSGDPYMVFGFGTTFMPLTITPRQRLDDIVAYTRGMNFGGTDCALPMIFAERERLEIDTFVIYTDSETWAGNVQPVQALRSYREKVGVDARLIVVGMVSNGFTLADPRDGGMLDVVGFDTAAPNIIAGFTKGEF
jgi:60 kDa SS-A/Ro ribonucleoprotein